MKALREMISFWVGRGPSENTQRPRDVTATSPTYDTCACAQHLCLCSIYVNVSVLASVFVYRCVCVCVYEWIKPYLKSESLLF